MDSAPLEEDPSLPDGLTRSLSGRVLIDRYRLGELLGRGELGDVYAADDLLRLSIADQAPVAVKVLHASVVEACGGVRALAPRLSTACRLSHPHLVNAYDFYEDGDLLLLAMECLTGMTLERKLATSDGAPPFSFEASDELLRQTIDALLHLQKTTDEPMVRLHPRRIWIEGDPRGVCIADLALSTLIDPSIMRQSAISSGSSAYMAPEVFSGTGKPDLRADQFSLGVLALTLFTGSTAASTEELGRVLGPRGKAWLEVLPRLLAPDPDHRFGNLAEVAERLGPSAMAADRSRPERFLPGRAQRDVGPSRRSSWLSFPRLALLAVIIFAVAVAAWRLTPDVMAKRQARSEAAREIDEAHRRLRAIDNLRIDLLSKGLDRSEFRARVQELAGARTDLDLATTLGSASEKLNSEAIATSAVEVSSLLATLQEREEAFRCAAAVIDACDELTRISGIAEGIATATQPPKAGRTEVINDAREAAVRRFDEGNFEAALATAHSAAGAAREAHRSAVMDLRAGTLEARKKWLHALRESGDFPEIEPVGVPADWLSRGDAAIEGRDWATAATQFGSARERYVKWATSLSSLHTPAEDAGSFINSLGMRFVPVGDLMASVWETRLLDHLAFVHETGADTAYLWREFAETTKQGPLHPVANVNLADAVRFCQWLTGRERLSESISKDQEYRIPTDLEWSAMAGIEDDPAKTPNERGFEHPQTFPWGTTIRTASSGNYATWPNRHMHHRFMEGQDPYRETAQVGSFPANPSGLHDLGGNVWEWTSDTLFGEQYAQTRVIRGGGWRTFSPDAMRAAFRNATVHANQEVGFRVVLASSGKNGTASVAVTTETKTNGTIQEQEGGDEER